MHLQHFINKHIQLILLLFISTKYKYLEYKNKNCFNNYLFVLLKKIIL